MPAGAACKKAGGARRHKLVSPAGASFTASAKSALTGGKACSHGTLRSAASGISGRLTKTFTMPAQASDASRWVRASPQKKRAAPAGISWCRQQERLSRLVQSPLSLVERLAPTGLSVARPLALVGV
ncbi:MAG: hypothetical protein MPL62_07030 [Alphaproteobacteria bacterium]|nr:hypothetical protein [Alphaproteobacteria bacterium]